MSNKLQLLAVVGALLLLPSVATVVSPDSVFASSVMAAEEKKVPKYKDVKTRKRASVGKSCAKALDKLQGEKGPITLATAAEQRLMMAQLYHLLERKDEALEMANIGVAEAEAKGLLPKEGFWNIQKVIYYDRDNLSMVSSILEKLVKHYPKWSHWRQLAGMYGSLERDLDQLVATDVVYLNNELKTEGQVLNLAYLYLGAEVPFRAAVVMEKGMSDEIIDRSPKNLETLGQAWLQAKNLPQALKAFEAASKLSDTGELQYRIASIYLDLGQDKNAYRASLKAERKGVGKNTASNYNKMGSALINLHCYKDAVKVFNKSVKAADTKKKKRFPKQWIKFANYEGDRLQKLRDVGATVPNCSKA